MALPKTEPGAAQRPPDELQNYTKYEVIREPKNFPRHRVKVILLEDIEGL